MAVRPSQYWPVLLGISLFAGVAGFRWASSGKGGIVVTVSARDGTPVRGITAFVDGALVACDLSPRRISEQASRIHAVKVVVPGFVTPPQLGVEVRPRTNVSANFQLDPSPRAQGFSSDGGREALPGRQGDRRAAARNSRPGTWHTHRSRCSWRCLRAGRTANRAGTGQEGFVLDGSETVPRPHAWLSAIANDAVVDFTGENRHNHPTDLWGSRLQARLQTV